MESLQNDPPRPVTGKTDADSLTPVSIRNTGQDYCDKTSFHVSPSHQGQFQDGSDYVVSLDNESFRQLTVPSSMQQRRIYASSIRLSSETRAQIAQHAQGCREALGKAIHKREDVLQLRTELGRERYTLKNLAQPVLHHNMYSENRHPEECSHLSEFVRQLSIVTTLESDLSAIEHTCCELERVSYAVVHVLLASLREIGEIDEGGFVSETDSTSPKPHPLIEQYNDKVGDMGIYMERLMELHHEYEEEVLRRRHLQEEQDEIPEISDLELQREYESAQEEVRQKIIAVDECLGGLRRRCISELGCDPEAMTEQLYANISRQGGEPHPIRKQAIEESSRSQPPMRTRNSGNEAAIDAVRTDSNLTSVRQRRRIRGWVFDVPSEVISNPNGSFLEHEQSEHHGSPTNANANCAYDRLEKQSDFRTSELDIRSKKQQGSDSMS